MHGSTIKVALVGNPNVGKTSIFNQLTGLQQKVGNYPGITVDKKVGFTRINDQTLEIIDLPGTYSIHASSKDESIVVNSLLDNKDPHHPDVVLVIADITTLSRNLLLFTQVKDLGIPTILVINMADQMAKHGITLDVEALGAAIYAPVILVSSRKNKGISAIKTSILSYASIDKRPFFDIKKVDGAFFGDLDQNDWHSNLYFKWLYLTQQGRLNFLDEALKTDIQNNTIATDKVKRLQYKETIARYASIRKTLATCWEKEPSKATGLRYKLDRVLTHKVFGYIIFAILCLLVFESIFTWATWPMDQIDSAFAALGQWTRSTLPPGPFTNLISEGVIPGLSGILIFVPQIAILFFFISILEETGYMSRVVFLMDKIMRQFGLSGKSVVPFISGTACAIPAIMATRNIEHWKERLIAVLVIPFITCAARLPVYAILIALIIPNKKLMGFYNLQGLTLMALYAFGFVMAVISAAILNKILKTKTQQHFIIELPDYRLPLPRNVFITVLEKTKSFVFGAGKIILAISIILWFLASNGTGEAFKNAEQIVTTNTTDLNLSADELQNSIAAHRLEHSYIGKLGNSIEPVIQPLGYDWKIGIALISSFAAREVFVGTLATIYSIGQTDEEQTVLERLKQEKNPDTGQPRYNFAVGISLLLFYALAMQCMSTLVIVRQETKSWRWPMLQLVFMTGLAYIASLIAYQILV